MGKIVLPSFQILCHNWGAQDFKEMGFVAFCCSLQTGLVMIWHVVVRSIRATWLCEHGVTAVSSHPRYGACMNTFSTGTIPKMLLQFLTSEY